MTSQQVEIVSKAEFCRRAGFTYERLRALIRGGFPLAKTGKVEVAKGMAWLAANVDPARKGHWKGDADAAKGESLNDFRRQREAQKVQQGEIEIAKARGELIEKAIVKKFIADRARMERDAWLAWSSAAAGRLAGSLGVDAGALFGALEAEVRDQLRRLAERPLEGGMQNPTWS
jgi:hypothetical protein